MRPAVFSPTRCGVTLPKAGTPRCGRVRVCLANPPVGPGLILSSLRRLKNEQICGLSHPSQGGRAVQRIDDAFCMELVK